MRSFRGRSPESSAPSSGLVAAVAAAADCGRRYGRPWRRTCPNWCPSPADYYFFLLHMVSIACICSVISPPCKSTRLPPWTWPRRSGPCRGSRRTAWRCPGPSAAASSPGCSLSQLSAKQQLDSQQFIKFTGVQHQAASLTGLPHTIQLFVRWTT